METIIAAGIAGIVALIGSYFAYLSRIQKLQGEISNLKEHVSASQGSLSKEHGGLEGQLSSLLNKHDQALTTSSEIKSFARQTQAKTEEIYKYTIEGKKEQEMQYRTLSDKQKDISALVTNSVDSIKAMHNELLALSASNKDLQIENAQLRHKLDAVQARSDGFEKENSNLKEDINDLKRTVGLHQQGKVRGYDFER